MTKSPPAPALDGAELQLCNPDRCPVTATMAVIGGKWKPAVLYALRLAGTLRFGQLRRAISGVTQKMLTQQLRELEADGIVWRRVYAEVPPRVEYGLTAYGATLGPVVEALAAWGTEHRGRGTGAGT